MLGLCVLAFVLAACTPAAPAASAISTAIAQTQAAASPVPTSTPNGAGIATAIAQTQEASAASTAAFVAAHGACAVDAVLKSAADMNKLLTTWDDASKLANSTPRNALAPQISVLQDLHRQANALEVPTCLENAKSYLALGMDKTVNAFLDFLGQKPDALVTADFNDANQEFKTFDAELAKITKCAPDCK